MGWGPWSSVSEGRTTPGALVSAVVNGHNRVALSLADPGGGIYTASGTPGIGWGPWSSVPQGQSKPGAPVSAVVTGPNQIALFMADPGGSILTATIKP